MNWFERLLLNLISYSVLLVPIALIVICTRCKLCPSFMQNNALVQWFVYGNKQAIALIQARHPSKLLDDSETLLDRKSNTSKKSSSALTFIWCFLGLQVSYLIWGVLQEKIMTTNYVDSTTGKSITFHDSQFLVFINRIIAFILSILVLVYNRPKQSKLISKSPPLYEYIYCSLSNILSSWCQYEALKYVNFPTQVLSKSCKIVPVMLMSRVMLKKKYQSSDYLCALFLSLGMFIFLLNQPINLTRRQSDEQQHKNSIQYNESLASINDKQLPQNHEPQNQNSTLASGLIILALYLAFDSFTSNWQQSLFNRYDVSKWQMMAATNFYSIMLTLTSLHQLGSLKPAFKLLAASPALLLDCLLMSVMSSVGQLFVYYTIQRFGPVIFTIIMTLRQFLAIFLSCTIYGHTLTMGSSCGLLLVFLVIGFQLWRKSGSSGGSNSSSSSGQKLPELSRFSAIK